MSVSPCDVRVSLTDGLSIGWPGREPIRLDARQLGGTNVVSHAHTDHLPGSAGSVVCSALTADLAAVRGRGRSLTPVDVDDIHLLPAGHVAGSRAAVLDRDGVAVLYTGDVCLRDRDYLQGFDPPDADVLVVEATYGQPGYEFPPLEDVQATFGRWYAEAPDRPVVLFAYALGKAQRVIRLFATDLFDRVFATEGICEVNDVITDHLGVEFAAVPYSDETLRTGDALVVSGGMGRTEWLQSLVARSGARTAGFSGWAIDESYRYRRGLDRGFVLSDHCDHDELRSLVRTVDPEIVYTVHGFTGELARTLTRDGYDARELKAYQSTIGDF